VAVPCQKSEPSCICFDRGIDFDSLNDYSIGFWNCYDFSYKPITNTAWVLDRLCKLQKKGAVANDKVYQFLAHGRWFSPGTPASSTIKTSRHDIAEILLKVALNTKDQIKS
jgi:hypothetical protein